MNIVTQKEVTTAPKECKGALLADDVCCLPLTLALPQLLMGFTADGFRKNDHLRFIDSSDFINGSGVLENTLAPDPEARH